MRFVDDTELTVFLWRHLTSNLDMRKLVLEANETLTSRLEEIVHETKDWRFTISDLISSFEELTIDDNLMERIKACEYIVGKEREREFVDDRLHIAVIVDIHSQLPKNTEQALRLLAAIMSLAVYPKDILSTAYLLSALCPSVLPAIKRLATSSKLNMALFLVSYIQKAMIDNNDGDDPVMKENIIFLKRFLKLIEEIHDKFDEIKEPKRGIRAAFDTANKFLLTCEAVGTNNLTPALKIINGMIDEVTENYQEIMENAPNTHQIKPKFSNETERVCQSVVDRLAIMLPLEEVTSFSPNLRTPAVKTPMREMVSSSSLSTNSENKATPVVAPPVSRLHTFVNNQTPTPLRPSSIQALQNFLEEEKENIDPNADALLIEYEMKGNEEIPARTPKPKGLRVRKSFGNSKSNQAKRAPTQRSILTFFK